MVTTTAAATWISRPFAIRPSAVTAFSTVVAADRCRTRQRWVNELWSSTLTTTNNPFIANGRPMRLLWALPVRADRNHPQSQLCLLSTCWLWRSSLSPWQRRFQFRVKATSSDDRGNDTSNDDGDDDGWMPHAPKHLEIPVDHSSIELTFVRSSGAGGQNVNKVNSQCQLRLDLHRATDWLPSEVVERLRQQQIHRCNKQGTILLLHVQEHRTQIANRQAALQKLTNMIQQAWTRPKQRNIRTGISPKAKQQRIDDKRKRSLLKQSRRPVDF